MFRYTYVAAEALTPQRWEIRRALITSSPLYEAIHSPERMTIIDALESIRIKPPIDLAVLSFF